MLRLASRYTHVPLAAASILLLLAVIAWLLVHRMEGSSPGWGWGARSPDIVAIPAGAPESASVAPGKVDRPPGSRPTGLTGGAPVRTPGAPARGPERYVLESGPFASPELTDSAEERLNRLGHATIRFRKQDTTRLYVVALTGFGSRGEAAEAVRQLGRGTVVEGADTAEVVVSRLPSLGEAVAAARPLRAQGFEVRVSEALAPTAIYHLRYGQFDNRADATTLRDDLARSGIPSRVVGVQGLVVKSR